ncbi:hypothetical protein DRN74_02060 [Candidatus Micrarchaeota archaeon]|nr:MAG: hypothetical protein DRN74_02060 [Candidatus Micrarchaeota archaeon]
MPKYSKRSVYPALALLLTLLTVNAFTIQCAASNIEGHKIMASRENVSCLISNIEDNYKLEKAVLDGENLTVNPVEQGYVFVLSSAESKTLSLFFSNGTDENQVNYTYIPRKKGTTEKVKKLIGSIKGNYSYVLIGLLLLAITFVALWLFKQFLANAIAGLIALLVVKFILGIAIPINGLTLLVSIMGGLGGVGALLIAAVFGWI